MIGGKRKANGPGGASDDRCLLIEICIGSSRRGGCTLMGDCRGRLHICPLYTQRRQETFGLVNASLEQIVHSIVVRLAQTAFNHMLDKTMSLRKEL